MENLNDFLPQKLSGKSVVVTGGTTGIGRSIALALTQIGARVFIFGRNQPELDQTIKMAREATPDAQIFGTTADVAKRTDIENVFKLVDDQLGGLDILINNAALGAEGVMSKDYEHWEYVVDTNLIGYIACARAAADRMKLGKEGHIVNIGSMSAETKEAESAVYVATKSGVRGFTTSLRKELNPLGIKVTLIEPGAVKSDMQPGTPEDHEAKIEKMEMLREEDIAVAVIYCLSQPKRCDVVGLQIRPHLQVI